MSREIPKWAEKYMKMTDFERIAEIIKTQEQKVYTVEEMTPEQDTYETFMVCSTLKQAKYVKELYERSYPQNEYRIKNHIVDDKRLIEMEEQDETQN